VKLHYDSDAWARVEAAAARLGFELVDSQRVDTYRLARVGEGGHAGVSDQKHCLRLGRGGGAAGLDRVALTATQAMRANAACFAGATRQEDYPPLSPRQQAARLAVLGGVGKAEL